MVDEKLKLEINEYKPLREVVFEVVRKSIILGKMEPGERLMETQLAEQLGVSRTPVREAIRKLELEGLVVMVPRRGAYVASMSVKDISETFEIRAALEGLAASLAVEKITPDELESMEVNVLKMSQYIEEKNIEMIVETDEKFHDILISAGRNQKLSQMISLLREQIKRFRLASLSKDNRQSLVLGEHRQILEAIADRDQTRAQLLVEEHIANSEDSLLNAIIETGELAD